MKKALIAATVQSHIAQFHKPLIKMLQENGYEVHVAAKNNLSEKKGLKLDTIDKLYDIRFSRSPYSKDNITAYKQLKEILSENSYDFIHCNTPMGSIVTRLAARKSRKTGAKVVYMAHGFHFFKGAPLINWLLYYPIERLMARYTDLLITMNKEDYERAKRFKAKRVEYISGVGFDVGKFANHIINKEEFRKTIGIPNDSILLLSVGELSKRKNHQAMIRALATLNNQNIHYVIAGNGKLEKDLKALAASLKIEKQVHLLGYRADTANLYKAADIFCFPSLQEGLPVALMESMASGLPVICSKIRGNIDLVQNEKGGFLYPSDDVESYAGAIQKLMENRLLRHNFGQHNAHSVKAFGKSAVMNTMRKIYGFM